MSSPAPAISRQAAPSRLHRTSLTVLIVGTVLAIVAAFGPVWVARIGVALAVATGVAACIYAWREVQANRHAHARELLTVSQQHGRALTEERQHNARVVQVLRGRVSTAQAEVERQRGTVNGMQVEISTLRGQVTNLRGEIAALQHDQAHLQGEIAQRERTIGSLQETVRARDGELAVLRRDGAGAEVHGLPRRVLTDAAGGAPLAAAPAVTETHDSTTVVDLAAEIAVMLPNYEIDQRFA